MKQKGNQMTEEHSSEETPTELLSEEESRQMLILRERIVEDMYPVVSNFDSILSQLRGSDPNHPIEFTVAVEGEIFSDKLKCTYKVSFAIEESE